MIKASVLALFVLALLTGKTALSQEVLVPLDNSGELMQISEELERELSLFPEYDDFREARLYSSSDTSFILEISYGVQGQVVRDRKPMTLEEATELRQRISTLIAQRNPRSLLDQSGRARFLGGMLTLSTGYYGWAMPVVIEAEGGSAAAMYMFTSATGYFIPYLSTLNSQVTDAEATLSLYGGWRGILHGVALSYVLDENPDDQAAIGTGMALSIIEAIAGYQAASGTGMTDGTASLIALGGDIGMAWGFGTGVLMNKWHDETESEAWSAVLVGSGAGITTGAMLAKYMRYSRGDVMVLRTASMLGALLPIGVLSSGKDADDEVIAASAMVGSVAGAVLGHQFVRSQHFTTEQGRIISLGTIAGGLFGFGIVAGSESADNGTYWLAGTIGATCGFLATSLTTLGQNRAPKRMSSQDLEFSINPIGLADATRSDWKDTRRATVPMVTARLRF